MVITLNKDLDHQAERRLREIDAATTLRDLNTTYTSATRPLGVSAYAVGHVQGEGRLATLYLVTWPRLWIENYAANAFIKDDPIVAAALAGPEPRTWQELRAQIDLASNRVLMSAAKFGFHEGFFVPIHGPGDVRGLVALAARQLKLTTDDRPRVVEEARHCYAVAKRLFERENRAAILTRRERDALTLVAQGLDDAAIGAALGVTRISAHVYVERAKRRLGANTRAQAVALAMADRLI